MNTALNHFAGPVQRELVPSRQARNLHRRFIGSSYALLTDQRGFIGWVVMVKLQNRFEGAPVIGRGLILRIALMFPGAVAAVNGAVSVEEQG